MNRFHFSSIVAFIVIANPAGRADDYPNDLATLTRGAGNSITLSWWGRAGRTYFLQQSSTLMSWRYFPDVIEPGTGGLPLLSYGFTLTGTDRYFLRLRYSDIPTTDPDNADFNGDGLGNLDDLQIGLDPLETDFDGDGLPNAAEYAAGTNAFWNDSDGDGVLDGVDAFPTDPTRSVAPASNPNDHDAPTIEIIFPASGITPLN